MKRVYVQIEYVLLMRSQFETNARRIKWNGNGIDFSNPPTKRCANDFRFFFLRNMRTNRFAETMLRNPPYNIFCAMKIYEI